MNKLFKEVEEFVPKKFYDNLIDEMEYHGYKFVKQVKTDILTILFSKGEEKINVIILFHESNKLDSQVSRKNDFDKNVGNYIKDDEETWIIYDDDSISSSVAKHSKNILDSTKLVLRSKASFARNINKVLGTGEYTIVDENEIKAIENMRKLRSFASVAPVIISTDVVCFMLRAKKGDFIKRTFFDPAIKNFSTKFFLVQ